MLSNKCKNFIMTVCCFPHVENMLWMQTESQHGCLPSGGDETPRVDGEVTGSKTAPKNPPAWLQCGDIHIPVKFHLLTNEFNTWHVRGGASILLRMINMQQRTAHYHPVGHIQSDGQWQTKTTAQQSGLLPLWWVYMHYGLTAHCIAWLYFPPQTLLWL